METRYYKLKKTAPNADGRSYQYKGLVQIKQVGNGDRVRVFSLDGTESVLCHMSDLDIEYRIIRRRFEAKRHPVGSPERAQLNQDAVTSEYMPSHQYALKGSNLSVTFKSKWEAELFVARGEMALANSKKPFS